MSKIQKLSAHRQFYFTFTSPHLLPLDFLEANNRCYIKTEFFIKSISSFRAGNGQSQRLTVVKCEPGVRKIL